MKVFILCCILAVAAANDMYSQYEAPAPSYPAQAPYSPPQPLHLPQGYVVAPPTPIQLHAPKPTTTTFLIHNAEAPQKPSLPGGGLPSGLPSGLPQAPSSPYGRYGH